MDFCQDVVEAGFCEKTATEPNAFEQRTLGIIRRSCFKGFYRVRHANLYTFVLYEKRYPIERDQRR